MPLARFRDVVMLWFTLRVDSASGASAPTISCQKHRNSGRTYASVRTYDYRTVLDAIPNTLRGNILQRMTDATLILELEIGERQVVRQDVELSGSAS